MKGTELIVDQEDVITVVEAEITDRFFRLVETLALIQLIFEDCQSPFRDVGRLLNLGLGQRIFLGHEVQADDPGDDSQDRANKYGDQVIKAHACSLSDC